MHQLVLQIWERVTVPPRDPVQWDCPTNLAIGSTLGTFVFSVPMTFGAAPGSAIVVRQRVWSGGGGSCTVAQARERRVDAFCNGLCILLRRARSITPFSASSSGLLLR